MSKDDMWPEVEVKRTKTTIEQFVVTSQDFDNFIGSWLNEEHIEYRNYVKGTKLFKLYLQEKTNGK
jgi:hypothetical protein